MNHAVNAPQIVPAVITHPATPTRAENPPAIKLGGSTGHVWEAQCTSDAPDLRDWRPTWAVMGRSTTAGELAHAQLNGLLEEDQ